jgi:hypothetical protein
MNEKLTGRIRFAQVRGRKLFAQVRVRVSCDCFEDEIECPNCAGTLWVEHWVNLPDEVGIDIAKKQLEIKETCPRCGAPCTEEEVDSLPYCTGCKYLTDTAARLSK